MYIYLYIYIFFYLYIQNLNFGCLVTISQVIFTFLLFRGPLVPRKIVNLSSEDVISYVNKLDT